MEIAPKQKNNFPMRRIFLFSIFFLCIFSFQLNAQRFRAGLTFGPAITDVKGTDVHDGDVDFHKLGFSAGGIVNSYIDDQNSFQFEINYITKGSAQLPDSSNNGSYKLALNYLEVPIVYRHRMIFSNNKKPVTHFEIEFGASVGRIVHEEEKVNNYGTAFGLNNINKTDVSLLLGLNYVVSPHLYFGFRYSNSLIPALKKNAVPTYFLRFAFNNGNNMVMLLSAHYIFGSTPDTPAE
jgi:hypothetical protein